MISGNICFKNEHEIYVLGLQDGLFTPGLPSAAASSTEMLCSMSAVCGPALRLPHAASWVVWSRGWERKVQTWVGGGNDLLQGLTNAQKE